MSTDIEILSNNSLQAQTRGEIDMQVATAKRYPRSIKAFRDEALSMATLDQETAEACFYALKRDGKTIEGPGVRLAEIIASCWGNLRVESRIVNDDGKFLTAQGTCWDVERNVVIRTETRRRVTGKSGQRFSDDMIVVTGNAAMSIALRNAIFRVVPSAYTNTIYEQARRVAVGDERTLADRRQKAFAWFAKAGATAEQVLSHLGKPSIDDVKLDDLMTLQGLRTAIQEGTTTVDQAFAKPEAAPTQVGVKSGTAALKERLGAGRTETASEAAEVPQAVADPSEPDNGAHGADLTHCPKCGVVVEPAMARDVLASGFCPDCPKVA